MKNQYLFVYEFDILYEILSEIEEYTNFNLLKISKNEINDLDAKYNSKYLIVSKSSYLNKKNQIVIKNFPITFKKLIEFFNIEFLKNNFYLQSETIIGKYKINVNSRVIYYNNLKLKLTEKEVNFILYLSKNKSPVKIEELQFNVWGFHSKLDTHTVETHIYRLRKKILKIFNDQNFIFTSKDGYQIK